MMSCWASEKPDAGNYFLNGLTDRRNRMSSRQMTGLLILMPAPPGQRASLPGAASGQRYERFVSKMAGTSAHAFHSSFCGVVLWMWYMSHYNLPMEADMAVCAWGGSDFRRRLCHRQMETVSLIYP